MIQLEVYTPNVEKARRKLLPWYLFDISTQMLVMGAFFNLSLREYIIAVCALFLHSLVSDYRGRLGERFAEARSLERQGMVIVRDEELTKVLNKAGYTYKQPEIQ